ncbi:MAG: 50S ribosomal protein L20 [Planctomycetota bacterium]|nr:50S ribosomal protein L20 [Planctomycetota bacterium]
MRVKTNTARMKYVRKVRKRAKGFVMGRGKLFRTAVETIERAEAFSTRDRRARHRRFRELWITRISAAARQRGMSYSRLIEGLIKAGYKVDRKIMADLAIFEPKAFDALVEMARKALGAGAGKAKPVTAD